ncbi:hypothetical protein LIER_42700 [Lithospermum erythrorhizon]|uniref:Uncharacterized protein n=1 Tax=Lithospermum erythrorhizon TaxID=34254 RepID=A0AAV3NSG5_LITER
MKHGMNKEEDDGSLSSCDSEIKNEKEVLDHFVVVETEWLQGLPLKGTAAAEGPSQGRPLASHQTPPLSGGGFVFGRVMSWSKGLTLSWMLTVVSEGTSFFLLSLIVDPPKVPPFGV